MGVAAVLIGICLAIILLFAIARLVFGPSGALVLVGYCFGGPPKAGVDLIADLVFIPVVGSSGILFATSPEA